MNSITDSNSSTNNGIEIIVVEDCVIQAKILKQILVRRGYSVILAKDGTEELEKIRKQKPKLVIIDISMPDTDGYEMCQKIKRNKALKSIPVILLTSLYSPKDIIRGLNVEVDKYVI